MFDKKILIYTYGDPYNINAEPFWDTISSAPQFCVSQTMVNGMKAIYKDLREGPIATVETLVKSLYKEWYGNTEIYIEQYAIVDKVVKTRGGFNNSERSALKCNRREILDSIRLIVELGIDIEKIDRANLGEEQKLVLDVFRHAISESKDHFDLIKQKTKEEVTRSILESLEDTSLKSDFDTVVFHGIHQFSPMILNAIEEVSKYKRVILLFNYQSQYKKLYQTWIDIYSLFEYDKLTTPTVSEFKPNPILFPVSYEGNYLADAIGKLMEEEFENQKGILENIEVMEFENAIEFSNYVSDSFEKARERSIENSKKNRSPLYYMEENFYSANSGHINEILKMYFPEQFGERHFLSYPIGQFFLAVAEMWDAKNEELSIDDLDKLVECLSGGVIREETPGELVTSFNMAKVYIGRESNICDIVNCLKMLKRSISRFKKEEGSEEFKDLSRLSYYNISERQLDNLISALEDLEDTVKGFYEEFESKGNKFKEFYSRIRKFIERDIRDRHISEGTLDKELEDLLDRVLQRLENSDSIKASGSIDCLKETMSYYFKQKESEDNSANWIVKGFEQIDGDILISSKQELEKVYHFCSLSDANMNISADDRLPWPLDEGFFNRSCESYDWKYQVFVKSMKEYKNFKRYALVYGLLFNRSKYKLSYIKSEVDRTSEIYYLLRILGIKKKASRTEFDGQEDELVRVDLSEKPSKSPYRSIDFYKWNLCPHRFALESLVEDSSVFKERFAILKYIEILVELKTWKDLKGKIYLDSSVMKSLNSNYDRVIRNFKAAIDLDKHDIISRAKDFLDENIKKGSEVYYNQDNYYVKRGSYSENKKELVYLRIDDCEGNNLIKDKVHVDFDSAKFNYNSLYSSKFETSADEWCKYCPNKEICLEYYSLVLD